MNNLLHKLCQNWKSGLTVSLVSIPLSVSLAVASNTSPEMGIVTAVYAGLCAALFGGSNFNVVGPTGALSGILATYAIIHGAQLLPMLALISGLMILVAWALKLERYIVFIPGSAIHGFTLGVAIIIGLNQLNFALGLTGLEKHEKFIHNVIESLGHISKASPTSMVLFAVALGTLFAFKKFFPKIPGAIIVAPVGIVMGMLASKEFIPIAIQTLGVLYPNMGFFPYLTHPWSVDLSVITPAAAVALVAIIETMVSAKIADGMTQTKHHKQNEMRGLAIANIASGIMGGMPATAALARTSLNVKTGATHKSSSAISSVVVAGISLFFLSYFKFIPLSIIAAILVYVAIQMVEVHHFARMFALDKKNLLISLIVALITIGEDPIVGILFGVATASLLLLDKLSRGQFDLILNDNKKIVEHISGEELNRITKDSDTILYSFSGSLCYINSEAHIKRFDKHLNGHKNFILRFRNVHFMDLDWLEAFDEIVKIIKGQKKKVFLTSINPIIAKMLSNSPEYQKILKQKRIFTKSAQALRSLGFDV